MLGRPSLPVLKGRWWVSGAQGRSTEEVSPSVYIRLGKRTMTDACEVFLNDATDHLRKWRQKIQGWVGRKTGGW